MSIAEGGGAGEGFRLGVCGPRGGARLCDELACIIFEPYTIPLYLTSRLVAVGDQTANSNRTPAETT